MRRLSGALAAAAVLSAACASASDRFDVLRDAQRKMVKVYGAGGFRQLEAYQSGMLISAEGHVLTALSYVLDTSEIVVVLDDGRRFNAEQVGSDPIRELALLKIPLDGETLPHFELDSSAVAKIGDRVFALSNLYGIASGDEPVSVLQGVVSSLAPLDARRGMFQSNFAGPVYVIDAHANNPGAAGGALIDWRGRLLGVLGKELKSRVTGAWLHYAVPVEEFADTTADLIAGRALAQSEADLPAPEQPLAAADLGIVLTPNILPRTPPYIDAVRMGSSAAAADLRPDDLIVFVAGQPTASCSAVQETLARREHFEAVRVSVLRDGRLVEVTLAAEASDLEDSARRDQ